VGLVRVQHGKRTVVLPGEEWQLLSHLVQQAYREAGQDGGLIDELYEVRLLLEPPAARWAAERATRKLADEIVAIVDEMESAIPDDPRRFLDLDREFHLAIVGPAAANRVLRAIVRDIHELLVTSWSRSHLEGEEVVEAFRQHRSVADAIASGDGAGAEQAMRAHLEWAARTDRNADGGGRKRPRLRQARKSQRLGAK
jgi:DNA-binding FadR family transcriptional regulator